MSSALLKKPSFDTKRYYNSLTNTYTTDTQSKNERCQYTHGKIKVFQKYINTERGPLSKEEEMIIIQECKPMRKDDNSSNDNPPNDNSTNDNSSNDNSSNDDNSTNNNSSNDNSTNDNSSNDNSSNDNSSNDNPSNDNSTNDNPSNVLVFLPTYNRANNIEKIIKMVQNQTYKKCDMYIIDDGSDTNYDGKWNELTNLYKDDVIFSKNMKNIGIAKTINKGIEYFLSKDKYEYFTWISDDNIYEDDFIETLQKDNIYFTYSFFKFHGIDNLTKVVKKEYQSVSDCVNNFAGCASFMWTKEAIKNIGYYNINVDGCEDFEYLIRTFLYNMNDITIKNRSLMTYLRHNDSLYIKKNKEIVKLKANIQQIFNYVHNNNDNFIYYSKTKYEILCQRPHQIMKHFSKRFNKIFIGDIENVKYEENNNLLVVPYQLKECIFHFIYNSECVIYYTDSRLFDEVKILNKTLLYDLIDAPINEFEVWKPNLEQSVKQSEHVMYSHPDLVEFLNNIDSTKTYHYLSNACDEEHFSKSKERIGERPSDFPKTDKPILGYYGSFAEWLNYDIIKEYADDGQYHILMIGGIKENPKYNIRLEHENITWLDHKPYEELPYYLSWFDKCFLPFKDCELTKYVNPCKLWEYMASGKEIIKYNVNMNVDEIISYKNVCKEIEFLTYFNLNNVEILNEFDYKFNLSYLDKINKKILGNYTVNTVKPTIIIFSMIDYYFRIQRNQHFARVLSERGFQVFYLKTQLQKKENEIVKIYNSLYEVSLCCNSNNDINVYKTSLQSNEIKSIIESIDNLKSTYNFNYFISYIANPFWYQVVKNISNTGVIFDCLDYTKGFNTHSNLIINEEYSMLENEYTIFTSPYLKELLCYNKDNFTYIQNGCDFNYFNSMMIPKNNKRKIVGYYGAISDWFDVNLMYQVIECFDYLDFHFIGNVWCQDKDYENKIKNLDKFKNVTFFGEIPYNELNKYVSKFDIGIIPFIINDLIKCTNPVKLYEMLSIGLPIVLVNLPDVIRLNKNELYFLSENVDEFIQNLKFIVDNNESSELITKRIEFAKDNDWQNRVNSIENVISHISPYISIVLLCWNHWTETKRCIESVLKNSKYDYYELIIVNNNSTDDTKKELEYYKNNYDFISIVNNDKNYGFAKGMNIGMLHSKYQNIILLNNDTIVGENWLYPLVKPIILNNYHVGSPITNNCGNEVKQFISYDNVDDLLQKVKIYQTKNLNKTVSIDRIPFFCPILRKHDLFAVGMLDERFGVGGWEDDDLIEKLKKYNPNCILGYTYQSFVYHMESLSMSDTSTTGKNWTQQNNNQQIFEKKWNKKWNPPQYQFHKLDINVKTKNNYILNLLNQNVCNGQELYQHSDNGIIISDSKNKDEICITYSNENNNEKCIVDNSKNNNVITLIYKDNDFILYKNRWNIIELYSIINTCINCL